MPDVSMHDCYDIRTNGASPLAAKCEGDSGGGAEHTEAMLTHAEIVAEIVRRKEAGEIRVRDLQAVLGLSSSRVSEILGGRRQLQYDEARALILHYGLSGASQWDAILPDLLTLAGLPSHDAERVARIGAAIQERMRADPEAAADPARTCRLLAPVLWMQSRH
jgi:hypothetical protein